MSKFRFCRKCLVGECDIRDNTEASSPNSNNAINPKFSTEDYSFTFPVTKSSDEKFFVMHIPQDILVNDVVITNSSESPQLTRSSQGGTPQNRRRSVKFNREDFESYVSEKHPSVMPSSPRSREGSRIGGRPNSRRSSLSYKESPVSIKPSTTESNNDDYF